MSPHFHLGETCIRTLAKRPWRTVIVDRTGGGRRPIKAGTLLALASLLAEKWRKDIPNKRVGIALPPGIGAALANLALLWANKIPVNLNFSAGSASFKVFLKIAEIDTVITAKALQDKFPDLLWPEDTRDVSTILQSFPKKSILKRLMAIWVLPTSQIIRQWNIAEVDAHEEATLLFSSGSSGEPKAVVLTHGNLLANIRQIDTSGLLPLNETLLASLPIFHSFGFTVTLWYPLITGLKIVTTPSPLEYKSNAVVVWEEKVTVIPASPTFLRPYLKQIAPEKLASLRCVIGGAEKTPEGFAAAWENRFGSVYLEGYGLTETAPVVSVNLPEVQGRREGSVGRLMPEMEARIVHPDSGEELPVNNVGMLHLKGPNIFPGYLKNPEETQSVFSDDWFVTGDLARLDKDGFLYIAGRLSRFSKIGGEMVSHGAVERHITEALVLDPHAEPVFAVCGVRDAAKGEKIILLSTIALDIKELSTKLREQGVPNLSIPASIHTIDALPVLASGKLDLRRLQETAENLEKV